MFQPTHGALRFVLRVVEKYTVKNHYMQPLWDRYETHPKMFTKWILNDSWWFCFFLMILAWWFLMILMMSILGFGRKFARKINVQDIKELKFAGGVLRLHPLSSTKVSWFIIMISCIYLQLSTTPKHLKPELPRFRCGCIPMTFQQQKNNVRLQKTAQNRCHPGTISASSRLSKSCLLFKSHELKVRLVIMQPEPEKYPPWN